MYKLLKFYILIIDICKGMIIMENEKTSIIDRYGDNFTDKEYITNPDIGRSE